jgi:hypothetical protein
LIEPIGWCFHALEFSIAVEAAFFANSLGFLMSLCRPRNEGAISIMKFVSGEIAPNGWK